MYYILRKFLKKTFLFSILRTPFRLIRDPIFFYLNFKFTYINKNITLATCSKNSISYYFPYKNFNSVDYYQMFLLKQGYHLFFQKQYSNKNCKVEKGDFVIDCGGFVGGFSVAASKMGAKKIFYIEPTPTTFECAKLNFNLYGIENINSFNFGLGHVNKKIKFNLSKSGADNSILDPDEGATGETIFINIKKIDDFAKVLDINPSKTFLKVEAEGFEIEILNGMKNFLPNKIVVDISPERNGKSPYKEVLKILLKKGYKIIEVNKICLFAKRIT